MLATEQVYLMGTIIDIQITAADPQPLVDLVQRRLKEYEHRFSANDDTSELMAVNQQAGQAAVVVDPALYDLIKLGKQHSLAPASHLNIAIGPLVQTWRIGFSDARVPSASEIQAALRLIDPTQIELDDTCRSVYLRTKGMALDLGALAKGYIADLILTELQQYSWTSVLLNLGGNLVVAGPQVKQADCLWRIGIQDPQAPRDQYVKVVAVRDQSVVTSGIYERQLTQAGHQYHHIFDQHTGYPVTTKLVSLTIIAPQSVTGEIWTTRLFGQPIAQILTQLEATPGIEGILITDDGTVVTSSGIK